jgi:lipooligosaccharide transport system permease protein
MVAFPRILARSRVTAGRAGAVTARNLVAASHAMYWWVLVSGFVEPVLYLYSIGFGVGQLVGDFSLPGGVTLSYAEFVAPATLAAAAMNGVITETSLNFFGKMRYMKLYDGIIATPVSPFEIALGELIWALVRSATYSLAFLGIMTATGLTSPLRALVALPLTVLVGLAFGSLGLMIATFLSSWKDFDYLTVVLFAMFLFSGTFAPTSGYSPIVATLVALTPLYHAVELLRGVTTGTATWSVLVDVGYLGALTVLGLTVAARRTRSLLCG